MIHFFSSLITYLNSQVDESDNKTVIQKIEELNLSKNLEVLIKKVRELRNKISHEVYELNVEEEELVENAFIHFMHYLILKQLSPLNINKIEIEKEYSFIEIDKVNCEILRFLHQYLGNLFHIKNFYADFLSLGAGFVMIPFPLFALFTYTFRQKTKIRQIKRYNLT
ncbi:MAG: hypothetical protein ACTSR5_09580 [Promethearchaeota archaeon]